MELFDSKVWVSNSTGGLGLSTFTAAGNVIGSLSADSLINPGALAVDASGDIWLADASSSTLTEFLGVAGPVITPMASAISANALGVRP